MASARHVGAITELNLSTCQPSNFATKITAAAVPGLRTSAAFLTFLRANLVLLDSAVVPSNAPTPTLAPQSQTLLPPVHPSRLATKQSRAALSDDEIPPLSLEVLTTEEDKGAALKLVADSIAQQRQRAASHLALHPLPLAALLAVLATIYRYYSWAVAKKSAHQQHDDLGNALMLGASGAVLTYLVIIRALTSGYLRAAGGISRDYLSAGRPAGAEEDIILGTRHGSDIVGALVLRLERPGSTSSPDGSGGGSSCGSGGSGGGGSRRKAHSRQNSFKLKGGRGVIRAWTIRLRYRGQGLGGDLLREAVRITRERCGRDAEVGFAKEHANSVMVLPELFNRPFRKAEMQAARALDKILSEWDGRRR
ncbi:hypothetical protein VTI28DRAFT_1632 [Corynascus sepedonium]